MADGNRVSFDLDGVVALARDVVELALSVFRPVIAAIVKIAGEGTTGIIVVFVIFFCIFLARVTARSGQAGVFGSSIRFVGRLGMGATALYALVVGFDRVVVPFLSMLVIPAVRSVVGGAPTFPQLLELLTAPEAAASRSQLFADLYALVTADRAWPPLGMQATIIVFVAFGCMYVVGLAVAPHGNGKSVQHSR